MLLVHTLVSPLRVSLLTTRLNFEFFGLRISIGSIIRKVSITQLYITHSIVHGLFLECL